MISVSIVLGFVDPLDFYFKIKTKVTVEKCINQLRGLVYIINIVNTLISINYYIFYNIQYCLSVYVYYYICFINLVILLGEHLWNMLIIHVHDRFAHSFCNVYY